MESNKRIAKNTILLYLRMILNMMVSIYTGRVVLQVLGVEDFGIYNILGGVVVLFSFINNFLNTACERFISMAIVDEDKGQPEKIFRTALFIHLIIVVLFITATETIGLWFVYEKLVIPDSRFDAALWLYHIYVFNTCLTIFRVPYNAAIIAEERMDFYAYTSIGETILRLLVVYLLMVIAFDKLITYALLHTIVAGFMLMGYQFYAIKHFAYCRFSIKYDSYFLKKMIPFSSWNLLGSIADLGYKQGTNIILNLFCGVSLNAAMGLATTVRSTIFNFITNFQVASNPQIIKLYSLGDYKKYSHLVYRISKFSYFLMLFLAIPSILNMDYILTLWLGNVPAHTTSFVILGLIYCLIDSLHGPLWTTMIATGKIRNYQLFASFVLLLNLPLSYFALELGFPPESIMVVQIVVSLITIIVRLIFSFRFAHLDLSLYLSYVLFPIILVTVLSTPLPYYVSTFYEYSLARLLVTGFVSVVCMSLSVYIIGLVEDERKFLNRLIERKLLH